MKYRVVLASGSPRRKEILGQVGVEFTCRTSGKEEVIRSTDPKEVVLELSAMKAEDVADAEEGPVLVLGADTVVAYRGQILGKPKDRADAIRMISSFAGETHEVYTGVCMIIKEEDGTKKTLSFAETTGVTVYPMTTGEIETYVDSGEPMDKAGAYAVQGLFAPYIKSISGDYYNIVGFPIAGIYQRLKEEGILLF
ncbi:MAG: Maf family protein [Lachnospiraceae bacterium]